MGHLSRDVDVERAARQVREVLGERLPLPGDALVECRAGDVLYPLHELDQTTTLIGTARSETDAAVAHDRRRDTVPRRGGESVIPGRLAVVVRVDVDEAGDDQRTVSVDAPRRGVVDSSDVRDPPGIDGDVCCPRRSTGAVHHRAALDHEVEVRHRIPSVPTRRRRLSHQVPVHPRNPNLREP
jgi:hypothetical protein